MIEHPLTVLDMPTLVGFPPAASNGGALSSALPKVGEWRWQAKWDDFRVMIHAPTMRVWNQYGKLSIAGRQSVKWTPALEILRQSGFVWLDAGLMEYRHDMMRGTIVVFDVVDETKPHDYRRAALERAFTVAPLASELVGSRGNVWLVNEWGIGEFDPVNDPMFWYRRLHAENLAIGRPFYEGLIAKRADAPYVLQQRAKQTTPVWVKHRYKDDPKFKGDFYK